MFKLCVTPIFVAEPFPILVAKNCLGLVEANDDVKACDALTAHDEVILYVPTGKNDDVKAWLLENAQLAVPNKLPVNEPVNEPVNDPVNDPVVYELVKALNELVVTKDPVLIIEPEGPCGPEGPGGPWGPGVFIIIVCIRI